MTQPKHLWSDVWDWRDKGIAKFSGFSYDLTPEVRQWLAENVGTAPKDWWWDHYTEEGEVEIVFPNWDHAMLFKLTWL